MSYNTRAMTLACIESIYVEALDQNFEIIIIDNQSADGSADAIGGSYPDVKLIRSNENLGFARANNLAAKEAAGKYILLLNPDTVVLDHAIDHLTEFAKKHPEARIWGGRTLFGDGSLNPTSCWRRMKPWSLICTTVGLSASFPHSELFNYESYGLWRRDQVRHVDIVTGCLLLTKKDFWNQLGGFDPVFFMYGEEADFCLRARSRGADPMITPEATIIHYGSASDTDREDKLIKVLTAKVSLALRHWSFFEKALGHVLFPFQPLVKMVTLTIASRLIEDKNYTEKARLWRNVWYRRHEWLSGYQGVSENKSDPNSSEHLTH